VQNSRRQKDRAQPPPKNGTLSKSDYKCIRNKVSFPDHAVKPTHTVGVRKWLARARLSSTPADRKDKWVALLQDCAGKVELPDLGPPTYLDEWAKQCVEKEPNYRHIAQLLSHMAPVAPTAPFRHYDGGFDEALEEDDDRALGRGICTLKAMLSNAEEETGQGSPPSSPKRTLSSPHAVQTPSDLQRKADQEEKARQQSHELLIEQMRPILRQRIYDDLHEYLHRERTQTAALEEENRQLVEYIEKAEGDLRVTEDILATTTQQLKDKGAQLAQAMAKWQTAPMTRRHVQQQRSFYSKASDTPPAPPPALPPYGACCQVYADLLKLNLKNAKDKIQCLEVENMYYIESWKWLAQKHEAEMDSGDTAEAGPQPEAEPPLPVHGSSNLDTRVQKFKTRYRGACNILRSKEQCLMNLFDFDCSASIWL